MKKKFQLSEPKIISKDTIISKNSVISEGTLIVSGSIINVNTHIGKHCIINTGSKIDHDNYFEISQVVDPMLRQGGMLE